MDRSIPAIITALFLLGVLVLMWRSWHKRSQRDRTLTAGYPRPEGGAAADLLATAEAYYVATTPRDAPLERLAIPGLGFRARAALTVTAQGITLDLDGNAPLYVPGDAIDQVGAAQLAIDRVVETDGLVRLSWRLNTPGTDRRDVDSFFRIIDPNDRARLIDSIRTITAPAHQDESEA
ncbi:hypothetical protein E3T46_01345 [Cryobacterium sp. Hh11]|uniref:PH-like domain-containing protein n=1 Tax=Cryobacterium sp. Hh11 TaxID=2555868 RepID=UPI00106C0BA6|nr:hypothetical protein [Cryobacterium sp. Hh11]TFD54326.1 hypothetical protein E3T46_01345 [Cryobacterium sp. Hh11]